MCNDTKGQRDVSDEMRLTTGGLNAGTLSPSDPSARQESRALLVVQLLEFTHLDLCGSSTSFLRQLRLLPHGGKPCQNLNLCSCLRILTRSRIPSSEAWAHWLTELGPRRLLGVGIYLCLYMARGDTRERVERQQLCRMHPALSCPGQAKEPTQSMLHLPNPNHTRQPSRRELGVQLKKTIAWRENKTGTCAFSSER